MPTLHGRIQLQRPAGKRLTGIRGADRFAPMAWSQKVFDPIELPNGGKLITLRDAANYIVLLPEPDQALKIPNNSKDNGMARAIETLKEIQHLIVSAVTRRAPRQMVTIEIHVTGAPGGADANWTAGSDEQFKTAGIETELIIRNEIAFLQSQYDISD
jgi:hypothetical protein